MAENDNGNTTAPTTETPEPPDPATGEDASGSSASGVNTDALKDVRAWRRTTGPDRKVAGVAGGIARALNIDPTIIRVLFVVLAFANGFGLILYALGWLLMPEDGEDEPLVTSSSGVRTALIVGATVLALVMALGITAAIFSGSGNGLFWPLFPLVGGLLVVLWLSQRRDERSTHMTTQTAPPSEAAAPPPQRPVREPGLFGITVALLAVGLGLLGIFDAITSGGVPDSAYPALALAIIGTMLVIGSVFGRAGGLIVLGIIFSIVLAGTMSSTSWEGHRNNIASTPVSASGVYPDYNLGAGNITLDLSKVTDLAALDGRTVNIDLDFGQVVVEIPDDLGVNVDAQVRYGGQIDLPDRSADGWGVYLAQQVNPQAAAQINLNIHVRFGQITVRHS